MYKTIEGKVGIKATVIADSISEAGVRLTTFEIEYPRMILSELNTHRMLSKNSASSRAIPFNKMQEQLTAKPVRFGAAQKGMQDKGEDFDGVISVQTPYGEIYDFTGAELWDMAKADAISYSDYLYKAGYHKQVYNRLVEPFQMMKTVISGTEWDNFFWLRDDSAADPTIAELARCMREAQEASTPQLLKAGQYHLPYVETDFDDDGNQQYMITQEVEGWGEAGYYITLDQAIKVSCARCAAISYRGEDYGLEKCLQLYERLVGNEKKHSSALEHCATPMAKRVENFGTHMTRKDWINIPSDPPSWEKGISHADRKGNLWSGNFAGFIQYRKTIPGENYVKDSK